MSCYALSRADLRTTVVDDASLSRRRPSRRGSSTRSSRPPPHLLPLLLLSCCAAAAQAQGSGELASGDGEASTDTLASTPAAAASTSLCAEAGRSAAAYAKRAAATVCIGFEPTDSSAPNVTLGGKKALFRVGVDEYSTLDVSSFSEWGVLRYMWVGVGGQRTSGQRSGYIVGDEGSEQSCVAGVPAAGESACYGWDVHNKPLRSADGAGVSTELTAIIHVERGTVTRVAWEDGCLACGGGDAAARGLECYADNSSAVCAEGACTDCYAAVGSGCGLEGQASCTPKVHLAWTGTDVNGFPMLSVGSIPSRFQRYALKGYYDAVYTAVEGATASVADLIGANFSGF